MAIATLLLLAVGCDKEDTPTQYDPNAIRVEAQLGQTRATLTQFEAGDQMSLYAVEYDGEEAQPLQIGGNFLNNERMTYDGGLWSADRTLYWSEAPCDFYGFYPYQEINTITGSLFNLPTDQNRPETQTMISGYEEADLMWAKAEKVSRADGVVKLQFKHMLSRLVVKIERGSNYEGELPEEIDVHIYNTATTALVNWSKGTLEKYIYSPIKTIRMRRLTVDTFDAIIVPQFIERSTPMVEVTMEGIAYLLNETMSFRPGMQHTIIVRLNTSPDQEKIEISIGGEIEGEW